MSELIMVKDKGKKILSQYRTKQATFSGWPVLESDKNTIKDAEQSVSWKALHPHSIPERYTSLFQHQ